MGEETQKPGEYTAQQIADALVSIAPAMQAAWEKALGDDELWRQRARKHGRIRTWWLRWKLRRGKV